MDFISFARCHGVEISDLRIGDGITRCPTADHPRSKNGAYMFDGRRGWVMDWSTGDAVQWWNDETAQPWTDAEKRAWAQRRQSARDQQRQRHVEAVKRAAAAIKSASRATHPYLEEKGHKEALCLVGAEGEMLVPMRDCMNDELLGLQVIRLVNNEWEKKMLPGMRAKGAAYRIGQKNSPETILVEGYATALSVDAAVQMQRLRMAVLVCFSAGNLAHVAGQIKSKAYVFADNDQSGTGQRVAAATGLPWVMSDVIGEDANDLHKRAGVMAVAKKILEVRR